MDKSRLVESMDLSKINRIILYFYLFFISLFLLTDIVPAKNVLTAEDLLTLKYVTSCQISPDGKWIAYTLSVPREASDKPGGSYSELYLVSVETGEVRPLITGKVNVYSIAWRPDGKAISFLSRRGENKSTQIWLIPVDGGESRQISNSETSILAYRWHPSGKKIAYVATTPKTKREKALEEKGYGFVFFEENLKHRNLYLLNVDETDPEKKVEQITHDITVWN